MTTLYLNLDRENSEPLHKQLIFALKQKLLSGELAAGTKLPSSRKLAADIGVSRIITLTAYEQLIAEGYLISRTGSGTFVSDNVTTAASNPHGQTDAPFWFRAQSDHPIDQDKIYDFSIGQPASSLLPEQNWRRAWRKSLSRSFTTEKPDPAGDPALRHALCRYLKQTRNIDTNTDNIVITSGAAETLRLIAKVMTPHKPDTYIESPGFGNAWRWLSSCGNTIPVSIDEQGIRTDALPRTTDRPTMLFLTPAHQFPIGYRLSLKRRNDILNWARQNDALILEDDYDSEFHYETMALPTLKSQDRNGSVLYFSSFSKSLSPNIKIGYLIAPEKIRAAISQVISDEHAEPPVLMQNAMAHFIESGDLEKHIARSRRHYTRLNKVMREKLSSLPAEVRISGLDSGIHAFLSFPDFPTELIKRLEEKSFHLPHQISENGWHGFALGYGHFDEDVLNTALDELVAELNPEL